MPLPVLVKTLVEKKLDEFCKKSVPPDMMHQLNLSCKIRGNSVTTKYYLRLTKTLQEFSGVKEL